MTVTRVQILAVMSQTVVKRLNARLLSSLSIGLHYIWLGLCDDGLSDDDDNNKWSK